MAQTSAIPSNSLSRIARWMNQRRAAGQVVQPWEYEQMATGEMDAAEKNRLAGRSLSLQADRDKTNEALTREQIAASEKASTMGAVGNLGTTALGYNLLAKDPKTGVTPLGDAFKWGKDKIFPNSSTASTVGSGINSAAPEIVEGAGGQLISNSAAPAYEAGGSIAPELVGEGVSAPASSGGSSVVSSVAAPAAYITGAELARGQWGGQGIPFEEKTKQQRVVDSPVTAGMVGSIAPWALNEESGAFKELSRLERQAMAPIDALFGNSEYIDTWLCTEVARYVGMNVDDEALLSKLRRYCVKTHRAWIKEYIEKGKILVAEINETLPTQENRVSFYAKLKEEMVIPVLKMIKDEDMEDAFDLYRDITRKLFDKYAPGVAVIPKTD